MAMFELYRRQAAELAGIEEAPQTAVGVDLGQARDPTAIAVIRRVPATRIEKRPDRPAPPSASGPIVVYARGSMEWQAQEEERLRASQAAAEGISEWLP
jgi:hypothetical protein